MTVGSRAVQRCRRTTSRSASSAYIPTHGIGRLPAMLRFGGRRMSLVGWLASIPGERDLDGSLGPGLRLLTASPAGNGRSPRRSSDPRGVHADPRRIARWRHRRDSPSSQSHSRPANSLAPDPCGEEEPLLAIESEDLVLAEPIPLGERLLLDDLVEPLAKRLVSRLGVTAGEFAELVAASVVRQVDTRHGGSGPGSDRRPRRPGSIARANRPGNLRPVRSCRRSRRHASRSGPSSSRPSNAHCVARPSPFRKASRCWSRLAMAEESANCINAS